jgi:hypothetical protein
MLIHASIMPVSEAPSGDESNDHGVHRLGLGRSTSSGSISALQTSGGDAVGLNHSGQSIASLWSFDVGPADLIFPRDER